MKGLLYRPYRGSFTFASEKGLQEKATIIPDGRWGAGWMYWDTEDI